MRNVEIPIPLNCDNDRLERAITQAIAASGLQVTLTGTLKKYPGCRHWHLKQGTQPGTLEMTHWSKMHRAWFTIQSGRTGEWTDFAMQKMLDHLEKNLHGPASQ